jgi:putative PEP-CTERM system TPR-repeat lipoprotein
MNFGQPTRWMSNKLPLLAASMAASMLVMSPMQSWATPEESKEYYEDARDWLKKGDYRAAVIQLRNALQKDSENFSARLLLGGLYLQSNNIPAAIKELEYAHNAKPSDETEVFLGRVKLAQRDYNSVLSTVRETADDPAFTDSKALLRAEALYALNRLDEAAVLAEPLLEKDATAAGANLLMARIEARRGHRDAAERHIDGAILAKPDSVDAYLLRARIALQARETDRVLEMATKIEEISPKDPRSKLMRAEALIRSNALPEAKAVLSAFLETNPSMIPAIFLHARVLMLLGEHDVADEELSKLPEGMRRQPGTSLVIGLVKFQLKQFAQAEEALERYTAVAGLAGRQARRLLASIQLKSDRPLAALKTLEPLTEANSGDVASFQFQASAALRSGNLELTISSLQRVLQIGSPNDQRQAQNYLRIWQIGKKNEAGKLTLDPVALAVMQALDLAQFGNTDEALTKAQALLAESPGNVAAANLVSRLYMGQGKLDEARAALEPILAENPTELSSIISMNRIDVSDGKFDQVEARLRAALAQKPKDQALILQLVQFIGNRDNKAGAIALLEQSAAEVPDSLAFRNNLIRINLTDKNLDAARKWADEAAAIGDSSNPNGLLIAGDAYMTLKDYPAAADVYTRLSAKQPENSQTLLKLAQAQYLNADTVGAKATLEKVLAVEPANLGANRALIVLLLAAKDETGALAVAEKAGETSAVMGAILRASVYRSTDRTEEAVAELKGQLAKTPSTGLVQQTYGMMVAANRKQEATALLASWLSDNPDDPNILQLLSAQ